MSNENEKPEEQKHSAVKKKGVGKKTTPVTQGQSDNSTEAIMALKEGLIVLQQ